MKSKSKSEGNFLSFITSGGIAPKAGIILILGILLIIVGNTDFSPRENIREEERIAELCAMTEGVGECRVVVTYASDGKEVYAVAVLCDGAESAEIRGKITSVICSLYGIGSHRVSVIKLAE